MTTQPGNGEPARQVDGAPATSQPGGSKPAPAQEAAIHCQKCGHLNAPQTRKCAKCAADLLPGASFFKRLAMFVISSLLAATCFYYFAVLLKKVEPGGKSSLYLVTLLVFGILLVGNGLIQALRKIPLDERYATRAKRHASLNKLQAIDDYGSAMQSAPKHLVLTYLGERARLFQELGLDGQAADDWRHALVLINERIARATPPAPDLFDQRAGLYKNLGMQDEYKLEMLLYSIEKEKTFKSKANGIAADWQEGLVKGSEDAKRQEFQKLRAGILQDPRFRITAQCKKCRKSVDLDFKLNCPKGKNHLVTNIRPILGKPEPS